MVTNRQLLGVINIYMDSFDEDTGRFYWDKLKKGSYRKIFEVHCRHTIDEKLYLLFWDMKDMLNINLDGNLDIGAIHDFLGEYIDSYGIDIYSSNLYKWIYVTLDSTEYMNNVMHEGFIETKDYDFEKHIQIAQYTEMYEVSNEMLNGFIKIAEEEKINGEKKNV